MDPFTEKLLERTRARRENLQKKMAERPNAAKRPLASANGAAAKVPQASSKPSPSKRRCSDENVQPAAGAESVKDSAAPPTDQKPPAGPASSQQPPSLEKTEQRKTVPPQPAETSGPPGLGPGPAPMAAGMRKTVPPQPAETSGPPGLGPGPAPMAAGMRKTVPPQPAETSGPPGPGPGLAPGPTPLAAGMRSRLQRLAQQRSGWDGGDAAADYTPMPLLQRPAETPQDAVPRESSEAPLGRRGRLADLAATIGSWEDDPSPRGRAKERPGAGPRSAQSASLMAASPKPSASEARSPAHGGARAGSRRAALSSVESGPQKVDVHVTTSAPKSVADLQRGSIQGTPPPSPQKADPSSTPVTTKPAKIQALSGHDLPSSPRKPAPGAKPPIAGHAVPRDKTTTGAPGVKSFLERFEGRCQGRSNQGSPAGVGRSPISPSVPPSSVPPNARLIQERIRAAQAVTTTTAELTQRQKLERESELAKIRSRFQKGGNTWDEQPEPEEARPSRDIEAAGAAELPDKPRPDSAEDAGPTAGPPSATQGAAGPTAGPPSGTQGAAGPTAGPPSATQGAAGPTAGPPSEAETHAAEDERVDGETEVNVDQSIDGLFEGVLEEEDALNISSMSLLTPLAAVVESPGTAMLNRTAALSRLQTSTPDAGKFQRATMRRTSSSESLELVGEDRRLPYSIDAYRSTRVKETERPKVKQVIIRKEDVSHRAEGHGASSVVNVKQKMKALSNELSLQETVVHQASRAISCCTDEEHGKGAPEEAEAQRLLLVATKRREALKAALDRLAAAPTGQQGAAEGASKGAVSVQELRLPLKAEFVCSTANKPEATKHSFFVLLRAGVENTVATPLASTHRGLSGDTLSFPTKFNIPDVSSSFGIDLEVYGLVQQREACSDKKKKSSKSKALTPKRFLAITKSVQAPVVASPGGPNAVRTSSFVLVGSHKLSLSSVGESRFLLEKVPFLCPLEGHVYLKMQCEVGSKVEERGFLTMFEDVSGFGAWHRRWCVLSGSCISYWTYPDDEKRKAPIGRVDLAACTSSKVEPASREFCARPNTLELVTMRPRRDEDRETLVSRCQDAVCVTRNWLSADTKDERNLWMSRLNQILVDLRAWRPDGRRGPP
ncbi:anillin [Brachionichthys hirsutus]|uniref:anillin n=1 Tax=Brachionichthys hirsutus TaxID=412623 RepID=UPI003604836E